MQTSEREILIKKLLYRTWHRGCKETDILLGEFCNKYINDFDDQQLLQLYEICEVDDWDLYAWITGKTDIPEEFNNEIMSMIMNFNLK